MLDETRGISDDRGPHGTKDLTGLLLLLQSAGYLTIGFWPGQAGKKELGEFESARRWAVIVGVDGRKGVTGETVRKARRKGE